MSMAKFSITKAAAPKAPKPAKPAKADLWIDVGLGKIMAKQTPN